MLLVFKDTVFNTDHISKLTLDEKEKSLTIFPSFCTEDTPTVINFGGNPDKEAKYRALFAWFKNTGLNIENLAPPPTPKK